MSRESFYSALYDCFSYSVEEEQSKSDAISLYNFACIGASDEDKAYFQDCLSGFGVEVA